MNGFTITGTVPQSCLPEIADIYFTAFQDKLGGVMKRDGTAQKFLSSIMKPEFAVFAVDDASGKPLGVAGFKTISGAFTEGGMTDIFRHYGLFGGIWRALLMSVLERGVKPGEMQIDGIAVHDDARCRGVGSALMAALEQRALELGLEKLSLDVIDTNPRARALYERLGFEVVAVSGTGPFRHVFGFRQSTEMEKVLGPTAGNS